MKNVVNYNATDVKRYIWNFKTNDPSKFLGEFFLPYFDLDDSFDMGRSSRLLHRILEYADFENADIFDRFSFFS